MKVFAGGPVAPVALVAGIAAEIVTLRLAAGSVEPAVLVSMIGGLLGAGAILLGIGRWAFKAAAREMIAEAKIKADEQRAEDKRAAAVLVEDAKEEAEALVHEAERKAGEERKQMHLQNLEGVARLVESVDGMGEKLRDIGYSVYGDRGRGGVWDELNYAADVRHQMIEHLQALEADRHTLGDFLCGLATARDLKDLCERLKACPRFVQPKAIERRRRRGDVSE